MDMDVRVWWNHYLFFLTTISIIYPKYPSSLIKKKYYDLIKNLPIYFMPNEEFSKIFNNLLNLYPITSYLDNKESLCKWVWFINNKINEILEKPKITLSDFYILYYENYKTDVDNMKQYYKIRKMLLWILIFGILIGFAIYFHVK